MKELITVATQEKLSRLIHEVCIFELLAIVVKLRQRERYIYTAPWESGLIRLPVTQKSVDSNPIGVARKSLPVV